MIDLEIDGSIAFIRLDNPPVNAVCTELLEELDSTLDQLNENEEIRCVIMTGEGKSFVAGADISEMKDMTPEEAQEFSQKGQEVFNKLSNFPTPVIAAVNGYALGGGMEIAMSCDFIIASEKALFGQPEVGLGVIPGFGGTQRLPRVVGKPIAKELIFTGKKINAEKAKKIGLVNDVVQPDQLMETATGTARTIAGNGPAAVRHAKKAIDHGVSRNIKEVMDIESEEFKECFETEDQKEGMKAFIEKRDPEFKNK